MSKIFLGREVEVEKLDAKGKSCSKIGFFYFCLF